MNKHTEHSGTAIFNFKALNLDSGLRRSDVELDCGLRRSDELCYPNS